MAQTRLLLQAEVGDPAPLLLFSLACLTGKDIFFQNSSRFLQNSCPVALGAGTQAFYQRITESAELPTASTSTAFLLTKAARGQSGRKTLFHWVTQSWVDPATFILFYASLTTRVPSLAPGAHIKMERENKLHRAVL